MEKIGWLEFSIFATKIGPSCGKYEERNSELSLHPKNSKVRRIQSIWNEMLKFVVKPKPKVKKYSKKQKGLTLWFIYSENAARRVLHPKLLL